MLKLAVNNLNSLVGQFESFFGGSEKIAEETQKELERQTEKLQEMADAFSADIDALEKIQNVLKRTEQIQKDLLELEQNREKTQYNLDTAKTIYSSLMDKIFNAKNPLYKVGSVNELSYKSIINADGTIDTVLANKLLTNLKFD